MTGLAHAVRPYSLPRGTRSSAPILMPYVIDGVEKEPFVQAVTFMTLSMLGYGVS
jgi:hypothetical protein